MTMTSGSARVTLPADDQLLITREFAAPAAAVWRAWTTPDLVKRWWSGRRGVTTDVRIDLRVGGTWRYVMVANEGFEVAFHGEYLEIDPGRRLVSTEVFEGMPDARAVDTLTLTERDGRTLLEILVQHESREQRDAHLRSGMEGGLQEALDLLEQIAAAAG